jgi:BlaI family penicillinase repressor
MALGSSAVQKATSCVDRAWQDIERGASTYPLFLCSLADALLKWFLRPITTTIAVDNIRQLSYDASMNSKSLPQPTEAELELLRILWEQGPSTVRAIHESLREAKGTGYTTTLKILQRMTEKGLVRRDETRRSHVYSAVRRAEQTQRQLVRNLLRAAFGGAPAKLVVQALSEETVSADELAEIRRLLDELEARQSKKGMK